MTSRSEGNIVVGLALVLLIGIILRALSRRSRSIQENETSSEFIEGVTPEPTPDEVRAAETSIRVKTNKAVNQAKRSVKKWLSCFW